MLKWHANFQVPDATVQVADALVEVVSFANEAEKCVVHLRIWDETQTALVKEYDVEVADNFDRIEDVYVAIQGLLSE